MIRVYMHKETANLVVGKPDENFPTLLLIDYPDLPLLVLENENNYEDLGEL